jgi:hypothetical protein
VTAQAANPWTDLEVIDSRAPRVNQALIGALAVVGVAAGWWWLLALLALQLALGLVLGRRFCVACLIYFGFIPPRAANIVGLCFLSAASVAYLAGLATIGAVLGLLVAALALLAATTGFCTGCEAYKLACRLTGRPFISCPLPPRVG